MKEYTVTSAESGQKCIKYCEKILPNAGTGFLHKMLRKKNITLNGKKADGSERLSGGDVIRFFFSDETFATFAGKGAEPVKEKRKAARKEMKILPLQKQRIIYEDENVLFYNKPAGLLSQKAKPEDVSLNEMLLAYLAEKDSDGRPVSKPSICNRLDRNTSGLVICGKTYQGLRMMNERIAGRDIGKYYHCLVAGRVENAILLKGYLRKDEKTNKVEIRQTEFPGASYIETEIASLAASKDVSLLEVHLITGKTHQIRSHLSSIGHPILGDGKYGDAKVNDRMRKTYGLKSQLLHAYRLEMPEDEQLGSLSGKKFIAPKPELFTKIEKEEFHGNLEF
ncbi:MAG: RluA family pseudouridine synthase [Lachnospiraceae bacterium]|nr:RluA family pseudouridine synthase [Lachnospiraceae bacterium]